MSEYNHYNWVCPYYIWNQKNDVHCEACVLKFKDSEQKRDFAFRYCCNLDNWTRCTMADSLNEFYERTLKDE